MKREELTKTLQLVLVPKYITMYLVLERNYIASTSVLLLLTCLVFDFFFTENRFNACKKKQF